MLSHSKHDERKRMTKRLFSRIEFGLKELLSVAVFNYLARYYQKAKAWMIVKTNSMIYLLKTKYGMKKVKILNMDMYGWTGVNIPHYFEKKFNDRVVILDCQELWKIYEKNELCYPVNFNDYSLMDYLGINLWELCKASATKHIGKIIVPGETVLSDEEINIIGRYFAWALKCFDLVSKQLKVSNPDVVIVTQGGIYDSRVIVEICNRQGIKVVALENCFSANHFLADSLSGYILNRHSLSVTGGFINECDTTAFQQQEERVYEFLNNMLSSKAVDHYTGERKNSSELKRLLSIPPGKKVLLYLGQVRTDASISLDSTLYADPVWLIEDLLNLVVKNEEYFLVVRLHPKEATHNRYMRNGNQVELCHNSTLSELDRSGLLEISNSIIISDNNINTYDLMDISDVGITINSQSGLEMALLGKQVITAGRCSYANKGFTWDIDHVSMLEQTINSALAHEYSPLEYQKLIRFCYYYFYHYMIPKDLRGDMPRLYHLFNLK